eukprot:72984-Chlamydomonas_euryale.AAC.9
MPCQGGGDGRERGCGCKQSAAEALRHRQRGRDALPKRERREREQPYGQFTYGLNESMTGIVAA